MNTYLKGLLFAANTVLGASAANAQQAKTQHVNAQHVKAAGQAVIYENSILPSVTLVIVTPENDTFAIKANKDGPDHLDIRYRDLGNNQKQANARIFYGENCYYIMSQDHSWTGANWANEMPHFQGHADVIPYDEKRHGTVNWAQLDHRP